MHAKYALQKSVCSLNGSRDKTTARANERTMSEGMARAIQGTVGCRQEMDTTKYCSKLPRMHPIQAESLDRS